MMGVATCFRTNGNELRRKTRDANGTGNIAQELFSHLKKKERSRNGGLKSDDSSRSSRLSNCVRNWWTCRVSAVLAVVYGALLALFSGRTEVHRVRVRVANRSISNQDSSRCTGIHLHVTSWSSGITTLYAKKNYNNSFE